MEIIVARITLPRIWLFIHPVIFKTLSFLFSQAPIYLQVNKFSNL